MSTSERLKRGSCRGWTSSAAASRDCAKMSPGLAKELASLVLEAASGGSSLASLVTSPQLGLWSRTSEVVQPSGSMPSVGNWEDSATKLYRSRCGQVMSARLIAESASLSSANCRRRQGGESNRWPTATAGDAKASGSRNTKGSKANLGVSLTDKAVVGDSTTGRGGHQRLATCTHGGDCRVRLSPRFVEWLMGFPEDWTVPD